MADRNGKRVEARRRVDTWGIVLAVLFLAVASIGLTGSTWWLLSDNWRWMAAGAVALLGVAILASSLPRRTGRR